jgi:hypothetical protein
LKKSFQARCENEREEKSAFAAKTKIGGQKPGCKKHSFLTSARLVGDLKGLLYHLYIHVCTLMLVTTFLKR